MDAPASPPTPLSWRAALAAGLTALLLLGAADAYARHRLRHGAVALAALNLPENTRGTALPGQLFARPGALPVYGSSELDIDQPTRADLFFRGHGHPRLQVFVIGQPGDRCLVMLQEIAALGSAVRGKKVALFLSPSWFLPQPPAPGHLKPEFRQAAATFSPLQTGRCLLGSSLRPATRRALAASLLAGEDDVIEARFPLLHQALRGIAGPTWMARCRFLAVRPLLALQTAILSEQDLFHQYDLLRARPRLRATSRPYRPRHKFRDWESLRAEVARDPKQSAHAYATPGQKARAAGRSDLRRSRDPAGPHPDRDEDFLRRMDAVPEWADLDLLLQALRELGARPLLISQPINGPLSDRQGITPAARRRYYERVEQIAARHHVPMRDFSGSEADPAFFQDAVHPSAQAWVLYDQALEGFFDGKQAARKTMGAPDPEQAVLAAPRSIPDTRVPQGSATQEP